MIFFIEIFLVKNVRAKQTEQILHIYTTHQQPLVFPNKLIHVGSYQAHYSVILLDLALFFFRVVVAAVAIHIFFHSSIGVINAHAC